VTGFELASLSGGSPRFDPDIGLVRVSGPYPVPEVYCVVLLICLALTLWWMLERGRPAYVWGAAAIGLEVAGISVTLFRAALIGVILILVAGFGVRPKRLARLLVVVLTVGVVLVLAAAPLQSNDVVAARLQNTENIKGRLATYEQSLAVFEHEPLTGVGVGQFVNSQAFVAPLVVGGIEAVPSPHSSFFGLLAEQGVLGLVPFLLCLLAAWGLLAELRRRATERADVLLWSCLVGAALAYLIMSLTLTMLPYGPSNAFLAVALGIAAARTRALQEARR
jgi:O-antigen ligase